MVDCPSCDRVFDSEMGVKVHHVNLHGESLATVERVCKNCDEQFEVKQWRDNCNDGTQFCSHDCWHDYRDLSGENHPLWNEDIEMRECEQCGVEYRPHSSNKESRFCSNDCYGQWMHENKEPSDTNFWKGGVSFPEYYGRSWKPQRQKALKRDSHCCQRCGTSDNLVVHHKIPVRRFARESIPDMEDAHALRNLVTYCHSCHMTVETTHG